MKPDLIRDRIQAAYKAARFNRAADASYNQGLIDGAVVLLQTMLAEFSDTAAVYDAQTQIVMDVETGWEAWSGFMVLINQDPANKADYLKTANKITTAVFPRASDPAAPRFPGSPVTPPAAAPVESYVSIAERSKTYDPKVKIALERDAANLIENAVSYMLYDDKGCAANAPRLVEAHNKLKTAMEA